MPTPVVGTQDSIDQLFNVYFLRIFFSIKGFNEIQGFTKVYLSHVRLVIRDEGFTLMP